MLQIIEQHSLSTIYSPISKLFLFLVIYRFEITQLNVFNDNIDKLIFNLGWKRKNKKTKCHDFLDRPLTVICVCKT